MAITNMSACRHGTPLGIICSGCDRERSEDMPQYRQAPPLNYDERLENARKNARYFEEELEKTNAQYLEQQAKDVETMADLQSKLDAMEKRAVTAEVAAEFFKSEVRLRDRVATQVQEATPVENALSTYHELGEMEQDMIAYGQQGYRVIAAWSHEGRLVAVYTK